MHLIQQLLVVSVHGAGGVEPCHGRVGCRHEGPHRHPLLVRVVVAVVTDHHAILQGHLHRPGLVTTEKKTIISPSCVVQNVRYPMTKNSESKIENLLEAKKGHNILFMIR